MKHTGPLLGYNNNIPYHGRTYHVQTEDSGARRPHVITHLFADGGRVVKSTKTSYQELVGDEDRVEKVRALMKQQHKAMVISLRDGELDHLLDEQEVRAHEAEEKAARPPRAEPAATSPRHASGPPPAGGDRPTGPPAPFDVLERAAAEADRELTEPAPPVRGSVPPPGFPQPEPEPSKAPLRQSQFPPAEESPGSYRFVGTTSRRSTLSGRRSQPPGSSVPPPARRRVSFVGSGQGFGARYISDLPLDEVILEFVRRMS